MTMAFSTLDVTALGSAAVQAGAFRMKSEVIGPDGSTYVVTRLETALGPAGVFTVTSVTAYVADGNRVMVMELSGGNPSVEREWPRFEGILRAAFDHQHQALG